MESIGIENVSFLIVDGKIRRAGSEKLKEILKDEPLGRLKSLIQSMVYYAELESPALSLFKTDREKIEKRLKNHLK
jgi:hypothetical protein